MSKIATFLALFVVAFPSVFAASPSKHCQALQENFPYGLIGDDHEILTVDDLAINTCGAKPEPFTQQESVYPYWQCFPTASARFECEDQRYDTDEKTRMAVLAIHVRHRNENHSYISRRAISAQACRLHGRDWTKLTLNEKFFCVSGPYWFAEKGNGGAPESVWGFDKFKTKRGCSAYFEGDCSLDHQIRRGCKIVYGKSVQ